METLRSFKILVLARWPLGGIRTYMRYMFSHFPDNIQLTIIATTTQEDTALHEDVKKTNAKLIIIKSKKTYKFTISAFKELINNKYDLIISQGYISAISAHFINIYFRLPHVVTIHGIVEPHYLQGRFGKLKRILLGKVLASSTVIYGVSNDILKHVYSEYPELDYCNTKKVVIHNGIEINKLECMPEPTVTLRDTLNIYSNVFLFGYFSRFMPQKGFDLIINAIDEFYTKHKDINIAVVAIGSGDFIREYQNEIENRQLQKYFYFLPFQSHVQQFFSQVDVVVMPSRWEACPLLPMEVLSAGVPLIATNCIGTREIVEGSPAYIIETENSDQLFYQMFTCVNNMDKAAFEKYSPIACRRFDVKHSADQLVRLISEII